MKVIWSPQSVRHLREVTLYIECENATAANVIRQRILDTKRRIAQMPFSGRIGRVDGTGEAVVPRTPYIIAYRVGAKTLDILGIWHAARDWPDNF